MLHILLHLCTTCILYNTKQTSSFQHLNLVHFQCAYYADVHKRESHEANLWTRILHMNTSFRDPLILGIFMFRMVLWDRTFLFNYANVP